MSNYDWSKSDVIASLERSEIGVKLATKVAKRLKSGRVLINKHRDYCGHGLVFSANKYKIISVQDGLVEYSDTIIEFEQQEGFISFLAKQSDWSLSGSSKDVIALYTNEEFDLNNQRLTKKGLVRFAGFFT